MGYVPPPDPFALSIPWYEVPRKCKGCGIDYVPKHKCSYWRQKYCSQPCAAVHAHHPPRRRPSSDAWLRKVGVAIGVPWHKVPKLCQECGELWVPSQKSNYRKAKFCSTHCAGLFNNRYRDPNSWNVAVVRVTLVEITCQWCGTTDEVWPSLAHRKFCSNPCRWEHSSRLRSPNEKRKEVKLS